MEKNLKNRNIDVVSDSYDSTEENNEAIGTEVIPSPLTRKPKDCKGENAD